MLATYLGQRSLLLICRRQYNWIGSDALAVHSHERGADFAKLHKTETRVLAEHLSTRDAGSAECYRICDPGKALLCKRCRFGGVPPPLTGCSFPSIMIGLARMTISCPLVTIRALCHDVGTRRAIMPSESCNLFVAFLIRFPALVYRGMILP